MRNESCEPRNFCSESNQLCGGQSSKHKCSSTSGNYECKCANGFFNYDTKSCFEDTDRNHEEPYLLHGGISAIKFHRINSKQEILRNISAGHDCSYMLIDYNYAKNYYVFVMDDVVYGDRLFDNRESLFETSSPVKLRKLSEAPRRLALDWIHDIVIISTSFSLEMFSVRNPKMLHSWECDITDFQGSETCMTFPSLLALLVDPDEAQIIMVFPTMIKTMGYDGSNKKVLYANEGGFRDVATYDVMEKKIYIANLVIPENNVTVIDLNGKVANQFLISSLNAWYGPHVLDTFGEYLVISKAEMLYTFDKHGILPHAKIFAKAGCNYGKLVHASKQPQFVNKCDQNTRQGKKCRGLCLPSKNGNKCIEPIDEKTCDAKQYTCTATQM